MAKQYASSRPNWDLSHFISTWAVATLTETKPFIAFSHQKVVTTPLTCTQKQTQFSYLVYDSILFISVRIIFHVYLVDYEKCVRCEDTCTRIIFMRKFQHHCCRTHLYLCSDARPWSYWKFQIDHAHLGESKFENE